MKRIISAIAIAALIAGCNESSKIGASPKDDDLPGVRPDPKQTLIKGHATDGLIRNGNVRIYTFDDGVKGGIIGTGVTDQYGLFDATITSDEAHYVLACVESGTYVEEASGAIISVENGNKLCAATYFDPSKTFSVVVNPFSHYAYGLSEYYLSQGKSVSTAITEANTAISGIFGFDILQTVPRDVSSSDSYGMAYDDRMKLGYATAAISQWALDAAVTAGLKKHTSNYSSLAFHQTIYNDLKTDGIQDGRGLAPNGLTIINLGMGGKPITSLTTRKEFSKAMIAFSTTQNNRAGVTSEELLSEAERIASSTHPIYGTSEPESMDEDGPTIEISTLAENQYVTGVFTFGAVLNDFSGIKSAIITDTIGHKFEFSNIKNIQTQINTNDFTGSFSITIQATDLLNNTSSKTINLRSINERPLVNITSSSLVNSTNYAFSADIDNYPQGIKSITVSGRNASITADGHISASLNLAQGRNTVVLSVLDSLEKTYEYEFNVDVDTLLPTATVAMPSLTDAYNVFYKGSAAEPYSARYVLSSTADPIYIDNYHTKLGPVSADIDTLKLLNWSFIQLKPKDPVSDTNTAFTPANEIKVSYIYKQGSDILAERNMEPFDTSDNTYLLPFSDEFLIEGWSSFSGVHELIFTFEDNAGNIGTKSFKWITHSSIPSLNITIGAGDWFGGQQQISFESTDFSGLDSVIFVLDGQTYVSSVITNPSFDIDMRSLSQGLHSGVIRGYKNGRLIYESNLEFSVDNTAALLTITSGEYSKNAAYVAQGKAIDLESGIKYVTVNSVTAQHDAFSGDYSKSLTVTEGFNTITAVAVNNSGISSTSSKVVKGDFKAPILSVYMPNSIYSTYYQNNLLSAPTLSVFELENNNSRLFFPQENTHLGTPHSKSQLEAKKIPYLNFVVFDPASDGAETPQAQIKVYMTYSQGNNVLIERREVTGNSGEFVIPLTDEFLGENFFEVDPDTLNQIHIDAIDSAGNTASSNYYFRVSYKPASVAITKTATLNPMNGKTTSDIGSFDSKYFEEVEYQVTNNNSSPISVLISGANANLEYDHNYIGGRAEQRYRYFTTWTYPVQRAKAGGLIVTKKIGKLKLIFTECETIERAIGTSTSTNKEDMFDISYVKKGTAGSPDTPVNINRAPYYSGYNTGFIPSPDRTPVITTDNYPTNSTEAILVKTRMEEYNRSSSYQPGYYIFSQLAPAYQLAWSGYGDTADQDGVIPKEISGTSGGYYGYQICFNVEKYRRDGIIEQIQMSQFDPVTSVYFVINYEANGLSPEAAKDIFKTTFGISDDKIGCNDTFKSCASFIPMDGFNPSSYLSDIDPRLGYVSPSFGELSSKIIKSNRVIKVVDDPGYPKVTTVNYKNSFQPTVETKLTVDNRTYSQNEYFNLGAGETKTIKVSIKYPSHEKMGSDCNFTNIEKLCDSSYKWNGNFNFSLITVPNLSEYPDYKNALFAPDTLSADINHQLTK